MKKTIIALWGRRDIGKTGTIKEVARLLRKHPKSQVIADCEEFADIKVVIEVKDKKIGINSHGDVADYLSDQLKNLVIHHECDVVVTATRTRGETVTCVKEYKQKHGYEIEWVKQIWQENGRDAYNQKQANGIVDTIKELLNI